MSFLEREISGRVLLPPREEQLQPREITYGSRNVPQTKFRLQNEDGRVWSVVYTGEMDGQLSQGDFIVLRGFERGPGVFRPTQIWLRGRLNNVAQLVAVDPPVRLASKSVCAIATCLYGRHSRELRVLVAFTRRQLLPTRSGRLVVAAYQCVGPWFTTMILRDSPRLQRLMKQLLEPVLGRLTKASR